MKKLIYIILTILLVLMPHVANSGQLQDLVYNRYSVYDKIREIGGNNKGKEVERILGRLGLPAGQPWCMALYYNMYDDASILLKVKNPIPKTGKVSTFWNKANQQKLTYKVIPVTQVLLGAKLEKADAVIFQRSKTLKDGSFGGHIGSFKEQLSSSKIKALEGNTGSESEWDGDGAFYRTRTLPGVSSFKILGFVRVR